MLLTGGSGSRALSATGGQTQPGDVVALHFSVATPTGQEHFRTQAKVARLTDAGNGMGVMFDNGLEERALQTLFDYAVASGTTAPLELPEVEELEEGEDGEVQVVQGTLKATMKGSDELSDDVMRDRSIPKDAAEKLKARVRTVAQRAISRLGSTYCKTVNEDFLVKARDAGTNAVQSRYFEALDQMEKGQEKFAAELTEAVMAQIDKVSDLDAMLDRRRRRETGSSTKLELVDTQQFEAWLLVAELISKTENRFSDRLLDMRAQFGLLARPWSHKDVNPVGPSAVCWAFDDAFGELQIRGELHKEMYQIFEVELAKVLANLYEALGKLFDDSGLFPNVEELRDSLRPKYTIRNRAGVAVQPEDYQAMDHSMREAIMAADGVTAPFRVDANPFEPAPNLQSQSYQTARSILDVARRADGLLGKPRVPELAPAGAAPNQIFKNDEIVDALARIQSEVGDQALTDTRLRPRLIDELKQRFGSDKGLTEDDYDTLSVMENLVDSLSTDQLITEGIRDWVQRLEITLNKLAAQDPEFLQGDPERPHSAVQMINQLARLGNSKDLREGIDREVGRRVDELLQRVVKDYDANPEVFSEVVDELHPLIDRQARTYRGNVERTVRASEGQQKLARARRQVATEVGERIADKEVPELLLELLNPGWRNLLVHTHLRHGPDSNEWRDQIGIVEQLQGQLAGEITPDSPDYVDPDALLKRVVEGLNSISFDPSKRTPLIMKMSSALVGDTTGKKTPVSKIKVPQTDIEEVLGLEGLLPEAHPKIETDDEVTLDSFTQAVDRARRIEVGEWLATSDREARPLILSVAFVGDESTSFVLVNRKGVKTLEPTLKEMAEGLHEGRITLLDDYDLPLMERASQRMLENMHNQLAFQASHDELTQLMNRKEFERAVDQALLHARAKNSQHALLYVDLDQFKIVNNTSGHKAGDELLRVVGNSIAQRLRDVNAKVARLGGDEFGILLEDVETQDARETADTVLDEIRKLKFDWDGRTYNTTASMGLVFVDQSIDGVDAVMQFADEACYTAKDAGRNRVQEYELGDTRMMERHGAMEWVTQLDKALADDRLILNCQKIQPVQGGGNAEDIHYEILLTMQDEMGDIVAPTELISAAETYNRMGSIDRWVIENVLKWMSANRSKLDDFGGFAINVSGHSVNDTTFPDFVLKQFGASQAPTGKVCFEITETAAIANLDNAVDFMNRMRIIGCTFSLDDFGTGLSSYSYLRNLPVDFVKIDGVFVRDIAENPGDYAVVRSINEIGHYMGKKTVAEFVEDDKVLENLREIGVDFAQGYAIERPQLLSDL
jgi:diguanylate cyclase (GGDEF)-like protein